MRKINKKYLYIFIYINLRLVAIVTLTKRKGHSNRISRSNLLGTLTSELKFIFKMTDMKGALRSKLKGTLASKCKRKLDIDIQMKL